MIRKRFDTDPPARRVKVVDAFGQLGVVAVDPIAEGEVVIVVAGTTMRFPSRYSIQVGETEHAHPDETLDAAQLAAAYPWKFTNHSCRPNTRLLGRNLVAVRAIARGEPITFDYNTTEYEMATPFLCRCGAPGCDGRRIAGYRHLSPAEKAAIQSLLSDALRARVAREATRAPAVSGG